MPEVLVAPGVPLQEAAELLYTSAQAVNDTVLRAVTLALSFEVVRVDRLAED